MPRRAVCTMLVCVFACGRLSFDPTSDGGRCELVIDASAAHANVSSEVVISASGGVEPYRFDIVSGGGVLGADGVYLAPPLPGLALIRARDQNDCMAELPMPIGGNALFYLGGGTTFSAGHTSEVLRSDDGGATWGVVGQLPATLRAPAATVYRDRIWIAGGNTSPTVGLRSMWSSVDGVTWQDEPPMPVFLSEHAMFVHDDHLWVIGGTADAYRLDPTGWRRVGALPSLRHAAIAMSHQGSIWFFAGHSGGPTFYDEVLVSTDANTWAVAGRIPGPRERAGTAYHLGEFWIAGGNEASVYYDDGYRSEDGATWTAVATLPATRTFGELVSIADRLVYVGGGGEVWATADGTSWETIGSLPSARFEGRAVAFTPR